MRNLMVAIVFVMWGIAAHADDLANLKAVAIKAAEGMSLSQQVSVGEESALLMIYTEVCGFPGTNFSTKAAATGMMLLAKDDVTGVQQGFESAQGKFKQLVGLSDQKTACGALMGLLTSAGYLN